MGGGSPNNHLLHVLHVLRCKMLVWTESIGSLIASRLILSRQLQLSDLHWTFTEQGFVWNLKFRIWNLKFGKWLRWKGRACEQHPVYLLCLKVYRCWNIKTGFAFLSWKSIKAILPPIRSQIQCEVVGDAFIFWQIVSFHRRHKYLKCEANAHKSLSHIIHIPSPECVISARTVHIQLFFILSWKSDVEEMWIMNASFKGESDHEMTTVCGRGGKSLQCC